MATRATFQPRSPGRLAGVTGRLVRGRSNDQSRRIARYRTATGPQARPHCLDPYRGDDRRGTRPGRGGGARCVGGTIGEVWDGTSWSIVPTPGPQTVVPLPYGSVSCTSASACTAGVGQQLPHGGGGMERHLVGATTDGQPGRVNDAHPAQRVVRPRQALRRRGQLPDQHGNAHLGRGKVLAGTSGRRGSPGYNAF